MISEDKKIKTRAQLKEYLDVELQRYPMSLRRVLPYIFQVSEGAILHRHTVLLRRTEYYTNTGRRLLAALSRARLIRFQNRYGIHVPLNAFGKGLIVRHVAPIIMNGDITVGENCVVHAFSCVVYSGGRNEGVPTLGDNVVIGIGAKIVGNVTIADNITIGAGAVVTKSFLEPGITIAGVPARKIGDGNCVF